MNKLSLALVGLTLAVSSLPVCAQEAPAPQPAPAIDSIDSARLAAAQATVNHIFPEGTYSRMLNGSFDAMMKSMMDGMGNIPVRELAALGGIPEADVAKIGKGTLAEMMALLDPNYRKRMDVVMSTMTAELPKLMATFEPGMRAGLARAYAKRYTVEQLEELNRFFATPTGSAYAADSMLIMMDPEVMARMQQAMPEMMRQMPAIMKKAQEAEAALPRPRRFEDLTKAERAKLAGLLGVPEAELGKKGHK